MKIPFKIRSFLIAFFFHFRIHTCQMLIELAGY
jgi:hypothetical protein